MSGYHLLGMVLPPDAPGSVPMPANRDEARALAVSCLDALVGTPYLWSGKDPRNGLDCSGAVVVAYERAGLARNGARYRYGSADLKKALRPTSSPRPGDCAFYGNPVSHVMMVADENRVIGATGGGRATRTVEDARRVGAQVMYKPVNYRKDLAGYGQAPETPLSGSASQKVDTSDTREERSVLWGMGVVAGVLGGLAAGVAWWLKRRSP